MALVEFSFASRAEADLPPAARLRIARGTWIFNTHWGLTGELRFERGRFRQVVEGPCGVVLPLASRILADPRHREIAVIALGAIAARRFATWTASGFEAPCLAVAHRPEVQALRALELPAAAARVALPAPMRMRWAATPAAP